MMFNVGDKVKIILDGWKEKCPKVYEIKDKRKTYEGENIYKLKGVPGWGLGSMIQLVERSIK